MAFFLLFAGSIMEKEATKIYPDRVQPKRELTLPLGQCWVEATTDWLGLDVEVELPPHPQRPRQERYLNNVGKREPNRIIENSNSLFCECKHIGLECA
jgi:hypothetical protein